MNAPSMDIKGVLVSGGFGTFAATSGWGIYLGKQPDRPHTTITVIDTPGAVDEFLNTNIPFLKEGIAIKVRSAKYTTGWNKAKAIQTYLLGLAKWDVGTVEYKKVTAFGSIIPVGWDERQRHVWSMSFTVYRQDTT